MFDYDVIVVGGGPIGLSAAYECVKKRGKKVLLIEQFNFGNQHGSSAGLTRQWRTCYSEYNLCKLAVETSPLWDDLMSKSELNDDTILTKTGVLWFGRAQGNQSEGSIAGAMTNLRKLGVPFDELDKTSLFARFPFIAQAVGDVDDPIGLFLEDGGTIHVHALIEGFVKALKALCPAFEYREGERVTGIDYTSSEVITVSADNRKGESSGPYTARKVILTPGTYINYVLATLKPAFPMYINLCIYLWTSTYFRVEKVLPKDDPRLWPIWYFFGPPKPPVEGAVDSNSYYGFPTMQLKPDQQTQYARAAPAFTSQSEFDFMFFPPPIDKRPVDYAALDFTSDFVKRSMPTLDPRLIRSLESTCIAGFAELTNGKSDPGSGFVLDFVPETNNRIVLYTGGWAMKFVPMFGKILADLAIDGKTRYSEEIEPMNISRGILQPIVTQQPVTAVSSHVQRAAKFNKIWS